MSQREVLVSAEFSDRLGQPVAVNRSTLECPEVEDAIRPPHSVLSDLKVANLGIRDASRETDCFRDLRALLVANEEMYPGIATWFETKVKPGLLTGERVAFVGYLHGTPKISAVIKRGSSAKVCHLRLDQSLHGCRLGELMFSLMVLECRSGTETLHFTIPESVWERSSAFFQGFGFSTPRACRRQYRNGTPELACSAPFGSVWQYTRARLQTWLPSLASLSASRRPDLVLSVKPPFAQRIMRGSKKTEVRRRFSSHWVGSRASIYASAPVSAIVGEVTIAAVSRDEPAAIWRRFNESIGCSANEFADYAAGSSYLSALSLRDVISYETPVPLADLRQLLSSAVTPPQSHAAVRDSGGWSEAIPLLALMRDRIVHTLDAV